MSSKPSKAKRKQMAAKQHAPQAEPKAVTAPEADLAAQAEPKAEAQAQAAPQPEQTQGDKPMKAAPKTQVKLPPLGKIGFFERLQCWCARNYWSRCMLTAGDSQREKPCCMREIR